MGSCHPCLQGQSHLASSSETMQNGTLSSFGWILCTRACEHVKPCSNGTQIVQADHVFNLSLRGFVHFATKEGAMRVLEESALLSFFELCFLMFLRTFRAALSSDLKKWPGKAALPIIEENSTSRPADEATSFALCTGHDLHGATHGMCVPFSLLLVVVCSLVWPFDSSSPLFFCFALCQKASESKKVMSDDERTRIQITDQHAACLTDIAQLCPAPVPAVPSLCTSLSEGMTW